MATDGGPKQKRPRKPLVVREREHDDDDVAPDSESPQRLRTNAWRWFHKDELAAAFDADAVVTDAEDQAAAPEIVAEQTISVAESLEPVADVVARAEPDNAVEPGVRGKGRRKKSDAANVQTAAVEESVAAPPAEEAPAAPAAEEAAPVDDAPVAEEAPAGAVAEEAAAAPAEATKRKRGPRKKLPPEPIGWFRSRAAAFFRARRSLPAVSSVPSDEDVSAPIDDATKTSGSVARAHLKGVLEALIFASEHPLSSRDLAKSAKAEHRVVTSLLAELMDEYRGRGVRLDEVAGGYVFRTSPAFAPFVREHVAKKPVKMTRAQVETLAIIAYKQPITRPEVDEVRGVDSGAILKSLLERDLVRILGKKEEAGRPLLYGTTAQFLEFFGLKALGDLPTLREFTELTDESKRMYEREMGEEPLDPALVLTNMDSLGTQSPQDEPGMASGGLMGGEGEFRAPGSPSSASPKSKESFFDETHDGNVTNDAEQGEEQQRMNNEQAAELEDLEARITKAEEADEVEDDQDEDEDLEDEDDEDEDEDEDDEDDEDEDEDEDDEDFDDEDEDEDDEDFDDEDEDEDEDDEDEDEDEDDEDEDEDEDEDQ